MGTGEHLHLRGSSPQVRPEGSSRPNVRSTRRSHILKGREKAREPLRFAVGAARADGVLTRNRAILVPYRRCVVDFEVGRTRNPPLDVTCGRRYKSPAILRLSHGRPIRRRRTGPS